MEIVKEKIRNPTRETEKHKEKKNKQTEPPKRGRDRRVNEKQNTFYRVETISCNVETKYHNENRFSNNEMKTVQRHQGGLSLSPFSLFPIQQFLSLHSNVRKPKHIAEWLNIFGAQRPFQYVYGNITFIGYFVCLNVFFLCALL